MAPPSPSIIAPVMEDAAGESTNAAARPDSPGSPYLRTAGLGAADEGRHPPLPRACAFPAARVGWCRPEMVHEADHLTAYYHG